MRTPHPRGSVLLLALAFLVVIGLLVPSLVRWSREDAHTAVRVNRNIAALNMAEAGVERGLWKVRTATDSFKNFQALLPLADYDFDKTFTDQPGGVYRLRITSGPKVNEVSIHSEARDDKTREVRAVNAVYRYQSIPSPLFATGDVRILPSVRAYWGPIMSKQNIELTGGSALARQYPRKLAAGLVIGRDDNGMAAPNTDTVEWWSGYAVPDMPVLDFAVLRASAAANGTLNCRGDVNGAGMGMTCDDLTTWNNPPQPNYVLLDPRRHPMTDDGLIWYWDTDVLLDDIGFVGHVIVRGDLEITGNDYAYKDQEIKIPPDAWMEYAKFDTPATGEYRGDAGYRKVAPTFQLGDMKSSDDVGIAGLLYVGGNLRMPTSPPDFYGAVWVVGNWEGGVTTPSAENTYIYFNDELDVPTLNIPLVLKRLEDLPPSADPWI